MDVLPLYKTWNKKGRDIFCKKCLTHERFFIEGHSWTPDLCSCGCEDIIVWTKMNRFKKLKAQILYNKMNKLKGE